MGTCFSKKGTTTTTSDNISSSPCPLPDPLVQTKSNSDQEKKKTEETIKKEIFIIQHRKSHEINRSSNEDKPTSENQEMCSNMNINPRSENTNGVISSTPVRTSSCSKEEVDAILIQCGRLSRSSSTGKVASGNKKYSGSKRSYDFDNEQGKRDNGSEENSYEENNDGDVVERIHRHRQRHRQSRAATLSPHGRRRTPSREREREQQHNQKDVQGQQQQRSGSRERGNNTNSSGRRVSRSPNRRSDSPITSSNNTSNKPGKMVSVPATVSSGETVKRIQVKRNVGDGGVGARAAASPRSRSPARGNIKVSNENQQQPVSSLSRSNSRKAEHSPYRRNPLSEIDTNAVNNNNNLHQAPMKKPNAENVNHENGAANVTSKAKRDHQQQQMVEEATKGQQTLTTNVAVNMVVPSGPETLKPQTLTRTRSSRQSRDLDINPSYTSLLLEDIQNFHQKNTNTTTPSFSLHACVTKANSILEAVADLNSSTSSNLSSALSEDRRRNPTANHFTKNGDNPIVESEVIANDDLMEPSFHKYVTVKRGGDMEDEESSGSNSFAGVGAQQNWLSSSSWEPNSADSTDCYTSSRSNDLSPLGPERNAVSENQQTGIGRGRVGSGRGIYKIPGTAAAST